MNKIDLDGVTYATDEFGVIHQVTPPQPYDVSRYAGYYDGLGIKTRAMSCLRLGHLLASVGAACRMTLLDIGYGNGDFLVRCADAGLSGSGFDVATRPLTDERLLTLRWDQVMSRHRDVVTFYDSLEHFPSLAWLSDLKASYVIVSAPWCHWIQGQPEFRDWKHRKPHEHLHHFNAASLVEFMASMGWKNISLSNVEDGIRGVREDGKPNILTAVFEGR